MEVVIEYQPISPVQSDPRLKRRIVGLVIAVVFAVALILIRDFLPVFPVIFWAGPAVAVAVAAGLFQALSGLTIFEVNAQLPYMPKGKQFVIVALLVVLLVGVLGAFIWPVLKTGGVLVENR